jgi:hypothetical protein
MATVAAKAARPAFRPSFHLWMTLLMAAFVFGGFGMTYLGPLLMGTMPPTPPVVHLHGTIFFAWTALLVVQSSLVNAKNVRLHRSLGTFGIALGGIVAFLGLLISLISLSAGINKPDDAGLSYLSLMAAPSFAVLFALAIRAVRTPAVHRNLILLAMLSILMPGINRLYMMSLGLGYVPFYATYLTMDAMLVTILHQERRATGRISRPTWIGAAIVVLPQALFPLIVPTPWFLSMLNWLGSLVYYR